MTKKRTKYLIEKYLTELNNGNYLTDEDINRRIEHLLLRGEASPRHQLLYYRGVPEKFSNKPRNSDSKFNPLKDPKKLDPETRGFIHGYNWKAPQDSHPDYLVGHARGDIWRKTDEYSAHWEAKDGINEDIPAYGNLTGGHPRTGELYSRLLDDGENRGIAPSNVDPGEWHEGNAHKNYKIADGFRQAAAQYNDFGNEERSPHDASNLIKRHNNYLELARYHAGMAVRFGKDAKQFNHMFRDSTVYPLKYTSSQSGRWDLPGDIRETEEETFTSQFLASSRPEFQGANLPKRREMAQTAYQKYLKAQADKQQQGVNESDDMEELKSRVTQLGQDAAKRESDSLEKELSSKIKSSSAKRDAEKKEFETSLASPLHYAGKYRKDSPGWHRHMRDFHEMLMDSPYPEHGDFRTNRHCAEVHGSEEEHAMGSEIKSSPGIDLHRLQYEANRMKRTPISHTSLRDWKDHNRARGHNVEQPHPEKPWFYQSRDSDDNLTGEFVTNNHHDRGVGTSWTDRYELYGGPEDNRLS